MTAIVHKHPILGDDDHIDLIASAQIIHAGPDPSGQLCIWEMHDAPFGRPVHGHRRVRVVGTGHLIEERIVQHLGSYVAGPLVLHLFEVEP